jgi:hypothetical protein
MLERKAAEGALWQLGIALQGATTTGKTLGEPECRPAETGQPWSDGQPQSNGDWIFISYSWADQPLA